MVKRKLKRVKRNNPRRKSKINWKVMIICLIIVYAAAGLGSLAVGNETNTSWYEAVKPSITPPSYVFPIVWNILFFLIGLSLYYCWINSDKKEKKNIIIVFGVNLFLNVLWSIFYFSMKNPVYAMYDLILLFLSIVAMIYVSWRIDKKASWMLLPYALWIIFAGVLNYLTIVG